MAAPAVAQDAGEQPALALMGTVPIYWGEPADFGETLQGEAEPHWARAVLEQGFALAPVDYLSEEVLAGYDYLLLAQPRGLSAEENVALDTWVREGGRLLLFADPLMTGESRFGIGDRRRPQDVALLSPILARWGLELTFDEAQAEGLQQADHFGDPLPVNMRGAWDYSGATRECTIPGDALLAHCRIGAGQALLVADAAMLDIAGPYPHAESALTWLLEHGLGIARENMPQSGDSSREIVGTVGLGSETSENRREQVSGER
ncbi:Gldg family protein [Aurantiacibacter gilvus]|uniref:Gldg family protein n=1 Tax=Aurantiacibacter gilvus TaxID=3139141 RepID=A0ABU9IBC3_9SPHN